MFQTLFYVPHKIFGIPVFGVGWALGICVLVAVTLLALIVRRQGWNADTMSHVMIFVVMGLAAIFLRQLEVIDGMGKPVGVPIRGYGVMLLLGVVSGVWLATYRAGRMGFDPDRILSLAFYMFAAGIVGARLFFIIEFWERFQRESAVDTLTEMLKVTEGGLVVYGSLIGALLAAFVYLRWYRLPTLATADLMAPSLVLGLAFGRIGCLLNGCCFGSVCDSAWAITFPASSSRITGAAFSPPYEFQLTSGQLHGIQIAADSSHRPIIVRVDAGSPAAESKLKTGDLVKSINGHQVSALDQVFEFILASGPSFVVTTHDGRTADLSTATLPAHTRPIHPTQIYSSVHALLLCFFLLAYYPFRRRDGEVIALCLTIYPLARVLLEIIRADESIAWDLTISQIASGLLLAAVVALWVHVLRQPLGSALPPATTQV